MYLAILYAASKLVKYLDPGQTKRSQQMLKTKSLLKSLDIDTSKGLDLDEYELRVAGDLVNPRSLDMGFAEIGGLDEIKGALEELIILPLRRPDLFAGRLLSASKGILLYGPPGTGKTSLAKALAKHANVPLINLRPSSIMDKWLGESQKMVRATFSLAEKLEPCIIFIDEIDAFFRTRSGGDHEAMLQVKSEFMTLLDGLTTSSNRVVVVGATNRPSDVDKAVLRRLPRHFLVDLPGPAQREAILRLLLRDEAASLDYAALAQLTEGLSGSDLRELCRSAALRTVSDFVRAERSGTAGPSLRPLTLDDFLAVKAHIHTTARNLGNFN